MTEQTIEQLAAELRATKCKKELAQARDELADAQRVALSHLRMAAKRKKSLAQARYELKDLRGANRVLARQVTRVRRNRDFWYNTCLAAEADATRSAARHRSKATWCNATGSVRARKRGWRHW